MDQEKRQNIALMKYSAIAPLISGLPEEFVSLEDFYRHAAAKGVMHLDGKARYYAPGTIESWYRKYMNDGFDGLLPTGRGDQGQPRKLTDDIKMHISSNYFISLFFSDISPVFNLNCYIKYSDFLSSSTCFNSTFAD